MVSCAVLVACGSAQSKPAIVANPEMVHKKIQLGKSYIQTGNFERAKFHLRDALNLAPESAEVYDALALMFMATGEETLADEYFAEALKRNSNNSRYRNNYASFLLAKSRYKEAEPHFAFVVEDVLYENRTDAMVSLAICRRELGQLDSAKELLAKVLRFNRLHANALYFSSVIALDEQRISDAFDAWQRLNMSSQESPALLSLGIKIANAQGRQNDAASLAVRLASLYPNSIENQQIKRDQNNLK